MCRLQLLHVGEWLISRIFRPVGLWSAEICSVIVHHVLHAFGPGLDFNCDQANGGCLAPGISVVPVA